MFLAAQNLTMHRTVIIFLCSCCCPSIAFAGPEPDATYKLILSLAAVTTLILLVSVATGFLARSVRLAFWRWFIVQIVASICGLALFIRLLSKWQTADDMTTLDLLVTDIIFETWSGTNLLLFASLFAFTCPLLFLSLYCLIKHCRPSKTQTNL